MNVGAVYVFERGAGTSAWVQAVVLLPALRPKPRKSFGYSLAVPRGDGSTGQADSVAVGAPGSSLIGEVHVFQRMCLATPTPTPNV